MCPQRPGHLWFNASGFSGNQPAEFRLIEYPFDILLAYFKLRHLDAMISMLYLVIEGQVDCKSIWGDVLEPKNEDRACTIKATIDRQKVSALHAELSLRAAPVLLAELCQLIALAALSVFRSQLIRRGSWISTSRSRSMFDIVVLCGEGNTSAMIG